MSKQKNRKDIFVYAHWLGMRQPRQIGVLSAGEVRGSTVCSFEYDKKWIASTEQFILDPDIQWFSGVQYPVQKNIFGIFLDSLPDRWGRTLFQRRESIRARKENRPVETLNEIDFLLGVHDAGRSGALRFKTEPEGDFLEADNGDSIPTWSSLQDLQYSAAIIERDPNDEEADAWLKILLAPGSSLGGARPKANILDKSGHPWIAKFPSLNDTVDKAAWEYLAYKLAMNAGIEMADSKIKKISGKHHTFLTKRFDRCSGERIHFASAMTMTGNTENRLKETPASYLDLAEFIQFNSVNVDDDLRQLWRRIIFNIAVSNTDDHLRNHGFIIKDGGWRLSPAYDINPSTNINGLALNIDASSNALDFDLAKKATEYFRLTNNQAKDIIGEVLNATAGWKKTADQIGISKTEQALMAGAFRTRQS